MGNEPNSQPAPIAYSLRPATADDFAFIHELRVSGLRDHVARIWGWDAADQRDRFRRQYAPPLYRVIVVGGRDVGAIAVDWTAREVVLDDIEIAPEWRGRGLGSAVLSDILTEARQKGAPVMLQVLKGNPALRLYERLGWSIVAETPTHVRLRANSGFDEDTERHRA